MHHAPIPIYSFINPSMHSSIYTIHTIHVHSPSDPSIDPLIHSSANSSSQSCKHFFFVTSFNIDFRCRTAPLHRITLCYASAAVTTLTVVCPLANHTAHHRPSPTNRPTDQTAIIPTPPHRSCRRRSGRVQQSSSAFYTAGCAARMPAL